MYTDSYLFPLFLDLARWKAKSSAIIIPHDDARVVAVEMMLSRAYAALSGVVCTNQIQDVCNDASTLPTP